MAGPLLRGGPHFGKGRCETRVTGCFAGELAAEAARQSVAPPARLPFRRTHPDVFSAASAPICRWQWRPGDDSWLVPSFREVAPLYSSTVGRIAANVPALPLPGRQPYRHTTEGRYGTSTLAGNALLRVPGGRGLSADLCSHRYWQCVNAELTYDSPPVSTRSRAKN